MRKLNPLNRIPLNFYLALTQIEGVNPLGKFGVTQPLSEAQMDAGHDIWDVLGSNLEYLTAPQRLWLISSNTNDAQPIVIVGINQLGDIETSVTVLNGQTPVQTAKYFLRVLRAYNVNGTRFVGNVYLSSVNDFVAGAPADLSYIQAYINPLFQQTRMSHGTVPKDHYGLLLDTTYGIINASGSQVRNCEFIMEVRTPGGIFLAKAPTPVTSVLGTVTQEFVIPKRYGALTDVRFKTVKGEGSNTELKAEYNFLLIHKDTLQDVLEAYAPQGVQG